MDRAAGIRPASRPDGPDEGVRTTAGPARVSRARSIAPAVAAVLTTVWMFRTVLLDGALPGDIGDARWTISLHEHWYRVWTGQEAIRDLFYYWPLSNTLGTSDAYLSQGVLYTAARLLGVGLIGSWLVASIGVFLIGALGVAVLARQVLDGVVAQCALVVLSCASYAVYAGYGHPQLFATLVVSWIFVGLCDLAGRRHVWRGIVLLVVVPPVLALSSWYPMVFAMILLALLGGALALVTPGSAIRQTARRVGQDLRQTVVSVKGAVLAVLFVVLWAAVLWVYLPSRGILPKAEVIDLQIYSPRWSDLINATGGGGGIWSRLYARLPMLDTSVPEQRYGFTPLLLLAFLVAGLWTLRSAVILPRAAPAVDRPSTSPLDVGRSGLLAATLTVVSAGLLFVMDERGLGLFRVAWSYVPGLESIRSPFRVMILLYSIAAFVVLRSLELARSSGWVERRAWRARALTVGALGLVLLILVEMQRTPETSWTDDQLLPAQLSAQIDQIRTQCDAFVLVSEDDAEPVWLTPVNAVILAVESGVPTPQGYGRKDPLGYPADPTPTELVAWMHGLGFSGRACAVTSHGVASMGP